MRAGPAVVVALCAVSALVGCTDDGPPQLQTTVPTPKAALALESFEDCGELRRRHAQMLTREVLGILGRCWGCPPDTRLPILQALAPGGFLDPGADAADRIVRDPDTGYFYVAQGPRDLLAIDAAPAEGLDLASRQETSLAHHFHGLYLDSGADRLVVLASRTDTLYSGGFSFHNVAEVEFYDIADPGQPVLVDRYDVVGNLVDARRVGQRLHVVTSMQMELPNDLRFDESFGQLQYDYYRALDRGDELAAGVIAAKITLRIKDAVAAMPLGELLPSWRHGLAASADFTTLSCASVLRPDVELSPGITVISSIDTDGTDLAHAALLHSEPRLHASAQNLYLLQASERWWRDRAQRQQTAIYRFGIGATGPAQLTGFAMIDGWLPSRSAASEQDGYLRIHAAEERYAETLTTGYQQWELDNRLLVLGPTAEVPFEVVGELPFLRHQWVGEARFIGDHGFAWIDGFGAYVNTTFPPLMTFDLSDPAAPQIAGSLALPANASYLHANGDDGLLAVTQRAVGLQWQPEVELQSFDLADPLTPQLLDTVVIGHPDGLAWSWTRGLPRSFALHGDIATVPIEIRAPALDDALSGFVVYRVGAAGGLDELGRVDHKGPGSPNLGYCGPYRSVDMPPCDSLAPVHWGPPLRSLRVDEPGGRTVLYTLSERYLKADEVLADSLAPLGTLPLAP